MFRQALHELYRRHQRIHAYVLVDSLASRLYLCDVLGSRRQMLSRCDLRHLVGVLCCGADLELPASCELVPRVILGHFAEPLRDELAACEQPLPHPISIGAIGSNARLLSGGCCGRKHLRAAAHERSVSCRIRVACGRDGLPGVCAGHLLICGWRGGLSGVLARHIREIVWQYGVLLVCSRHLWACLWTSCLPIMHAGYFLSHHWRDLVPGVCCGHHEPARVGAVCGSHAVSLQPVPSRYF